MTVRFIRPSVDPRPCTAYGEKFPSDEIQALWNMVTPDLDVHWVAVGFFMIRFSDPVRQSGLGYPVFVPGTRAHVYSAWLGAIDTVLGESRHE